MRRRRQRCAHGRHPGPHVAFTADPPAREDAGSVEGTSAAAEPAMAARLEKEATTRPVCAPATPRFALQEAPVHVDMRAKMAEVSMSQLPAEHWPRRGPLACRSAASVIRAHAAPNWSTRLQPKLQRRRSLVSASLSFIHRSRSGCRPGWHPSGRRQTTNAKCHRTSRIWQRRARARQRSWHAVLRRARGRHSVSRAKTPSVRH